jgi:molybdopterin-guanine dinucleotide biosynthesis protein A
MEPGVLNSLRRCSRRVSPRKWQTQCYHFHVDRAGYLLVGGMSRRMGRDKALLPFRDGALAQTVARAVASAAGSVVLVGDPLRYGRLGLPVIADLHPGEGPLGGILTALAHTQAEWNIVTACDMPGLSSEFLVSLLEKAERTGAEALVPAGPSGRPEPLCAVYSRRALPALEAAFAGGVRKIAEALESTRAVFVPVSEALYFQNVNTPEEWAACAE